jgi:hypothetical protein
MNGEVKNAKAIRLIQWIRVVSAVVIVTCIVAAYLSRSCLPLSGALTNVLALATTFWAIKRIRARED